MKLHFCVLICFAAPALIAGAKIIAISVMGAKSQQQNFLPVLASLATKGHEVTFVTSYKAKKKTPYREIFFDGAKEKLDAFVERGYKDKSAKLILEIFNLMVGLCEHNLALHPKSQETFFGEERYDAVIIVGFMSECFYPLARRWNASLIMYGAGAPLLTDMNAMGNPFPYSSEPMPLMIMPERPMFFGERLKNTIASSMQAAMHWYLYIPKVQEVVSKHFPEEDSSIVDIIYDISLIFVMQHFSTSHAKALIPAVVELGCVSCSNPANPLPKEMETFIQAGGDSGFVYFSFGTVISGPVTRAFSPEDVKAMFASFAKMPQRFLIKLDRDDLPAPPENVMVGNWFPQMDLLGHPKIRLFITHGGMNSQLESMYYGVPMIGCPISGDQNANVYRMVQSGIGLQVELADLSTEKLYTTMNTIIGNSSFAETAKLLSSRAQDRPMAPIDTALYWIEYVIRHNGARHLKPFGHKLSFAQYFLLDVFAVLVGFLLAFILVIWLLLRCCCFLCCSRKNKNKTE